MLTASSDKLDGPRLKFTELVRHGRYWKGVAVSTSCGLLCFGCLNGKSRFFVARQLPKIHALV